MGVVNLPSGAPTMALTGGALVRLQKILPKGHRAAIHLTITDDFPLAQAFVIIEALPAIRLNGLHFFTATEWNPGNLYGNTVVTDGVPHPTGAYYGALPLIVGTLASSAIALIVAVPVSIGAAGFSESSEGNMIFDSNGRLSVRA